MGKAFIQINMFLKFHASNQDVVALLLLEVENKSYSSALSMCVALLSSLLLGYNHSTILKLKGGDFWMLMTFDYLHPD